MYERTRFGTTPHSQKVVKIRTLTDRPWMAREKAGRRSGLCGWSCGRIWSRQQWPLLALSTFSQRKSKLASAIAPLHKAVLRHDNARR